METLEEFNAAYVDGADLSAVDGLKEIRGGLAEHIPFFMDDEEWAGEEILFYPDGKQLLCDCGRVPVRRVCFDHEDMGRRFICCPKPDLEECEYMCWYDAPRPGPMQRCLWQTWKRLEVCRGSAQMKADTRVEQMRVDAEDTIKKIKSECDAKLDDFSSAASVRIDGLKAELDAKNSWLMLCVGAFTGILASYVAMSIQSVLARKS